MTRAILVLAALVVFGCQSGSDGKTAPAPAPATAAAAKSRVFVIVMENKEADQVIGSASAPYTTSLGRRYAVATRSYGVAHPSLPNYFALTAGSTLGVTSNCTGCQQSAGNIADRLDSAGVSWKAYMGGMPSACFKGATSGRYAKKHNPFMYYRSVADDPARCRKVVPSSQLAKDLRAGRLPTFAFLTPDLCEDTHDCPVSTGDRYLARTVPPILKRLGPRGFLVLTYDEGSSDAGCCGGLARGGRIATVIAGRGVKRGARLSTPVTHYSTLRTIEDALRLRRLGHARDAGTRSLDAVFKRRPRLR